MIIDGKLILCLPTKSLWSVESSELFIHQETLWSSLHTQYCLLKMSIFKCLCEDNFYFLLEASLSSDTMPYAFRPKETISHLKMSQSSILTSMGSLSSMRSSHFCCNNLIERVNLPKKQDKSKTRL